MTWNPKTWGFQEIPTSPNFNTELRDRMIAVHTAMDDNHHIIYPVIQTKTSNYTVAGTDDVVNCTSGTFTVTLPSAVGRTGKPFIIKNSGTGLITVNTTSSQTIDGVLTMTLAPTQSLTVWSDGTNWQSQGASGGMIHSGSGASSTTTANNLDSFVVPTLGTTDFLRFTIQGNAETQSLTRLDLYSVTDSLQIARLSLGGSIGAGVPLFCDVRLCADQSAQTKYVSGVNGQTSGGSVSETANVTATTALNANPTIALRSGGVTSGGTWRWKWWVELVRG